MTKAVALDIDDTLYSFGDLSRGILSEEAARTGDLTLKNAAYSPWTEWRTPPDLMGLETWMDIIAKSHTDEMIFQQNAYAGALEVVWNIYNSGNNIVYCSNRREDSEGATWAWLEKCGFPSPGQGCPKDNVQLVCTSKSKAPYIAHCQYIIDDRPKTLIEFTYDYDWKNKYGSNNKSLSRKGFGLRKEYNCSLSDVPGIYLAPSWKLMEVYLIDKGVITNTKAGSWPTDRLNLRDAAIVRV